MASFDSSRCEPLCTSEIKNFVAAAPPQVTVATDLPLGASTAALDSFWPGGETMCSSRFLVATSHTDKPFEEVRYRRPSADKQWGRSHSSHLIRSINAPVAASWRSSPPS